MVRSKYGNKKTFIDGYKFDSIAESLRYQELKLMVHAGEIGNLYLQPRYELQPSFVYDDKRIRAIVYIADFEYWDNSLGEIVTEDVKGIETAVFKIKHKMFKWRFGRAIKLVKAR